ncbi:hypothetical protein TELCIR_06954 [Teladorsagia circumcincta]|uniref:Peptidase M13 C-terminal domain-containing protein n=1 Tax=Teladorsagia circumcincta TaxID=45464 RepID=A0A2G9ULY6_TELCI|nr:hypothetical protein TELCIR_06954 [Teladorsagia circumcincta]
MVSMFRDIMVELLTKDDNPPKFGGFNAILLVDEAHLLTNPHAPSSCRTNQVLQDIPEFARDFQCKMGQRMYPTPDQRCKYKVVDVSKDNFQAAAFLLNGLDQSVDPCEDFYAFTCNKFIAQVNLTALGQSRLGTYDQAQVDVNTLVAAALKNVDVNDDKKWSATERITKAPSLSMPRDFYTLPQFVDKLNSRAEQIETVMKVFAADVTDDSSKYAATIKKVKLFTRFQEK